MSARPFLIATAAVMLLAGLGDSASAQNYPWCAQYSARDGARNCGFVSFNQCMATVTGIGGFCERNAMYVPTEPRRVLR